jgi:hypothetical protein
MNFYPILIHIHSGLRWLALVLLILAIVDAAVKMRRRYNVGKNRPAFHLPAMIVIHIQLVIGLVLYLISPKVIFDAASMKDTVLRFYLVEHIALMLAAVILITVGYVKAKKKSDPVKKNRTIFIYYTIGLILILVSIPWPFRGLGAGWF